MVVCLERDANDLHRPYGSADATATPSSLASAKSRMAYPSGTGLPRLPWKKGCKTFVYVSVVIGLLTVITKKRRAAPCHQ